MLQNVLFELVLILFMIGINGIFAMSEISVVSAKKIRLQQAADAGDAGARAALQLAESPNRFLSTVQVGITLIGILAGAFGGATLAEELAHSLEAVPAIGQYAEAISVVAVVLLTTYLSLIFGELVPKRFGLANPERIAAIVARPMQWLSSAAKPVVSLLTFSSDLVLRLIGGKPSGEASISEEEITLLIEQGIDEGVFEQAEHEIVERVLRLDARRVSAIMTPRTEITCLNINEPAKTTREKIAASGYGNYPVNEGSIDHTLGIVAVKRLWALEAESGTLNLRGAMQPALFVPETTSVLTLLHRFKETRQHLAIAINEHGGVEGMVTLRDVLEAIVGDIPSLDDAPDEPPSIIARDATSWLVDGRVLIDEFKRKFEIEELPHETLSDFQTVGGFVMSYLEHIPSTGERFEWGGLRYEVVDMDGHRVDKMLITRLPADA